MDADSGAPLGFADGPKLELDQLIEELVERARGVQRTQGRLRELLRAIELVTGHLGLDVVLPHIAQAACTLANARYGALGVIAHDGGLEQFIHVGMDDDAVERIGHLPQGKGLLGALITDPRPIRLTHMSDDPRSTGFPAGHPAMESFLGVPIRVRDEVFGNLYLADSLTGRFSEDDEELVRALAVAAGTAISNARRYAESRLQQRWLGASAEISAQLMSASGEDPLRMIARRASEIAEADVVTLALRVPDADEVMIEVAVGRGAEGLLGRRFPIADTLAGKVVEDEAPLLLRSVSDAPGRRSMVDSVIEPGPIMVIPLAGAGIARGALTIARVSGRPIFSAADLAMAAGFANHASVALELAAARADQQRMVLLEDRERIARDLHDHVIQQLFAIGLSLEGVAARMGTDEKLVDTLRTRVSDIDRTIRQIRSSIFELRGPLGGGPEGTRSRTMEIISDVTAALGFTPSIAFSGPVDVVVVGDLADDLCACLREGLTNVAKHAHASSVDVDVSAVGGELVLSVRDNGVGLSGAARSSGLTNLRNRAEQRGGTLELTSSPSGGTHLTWKAPIT